MPPSSGRGREERKERKKNGGAPGEKGRQKKSIEIRPICPAFQTPRSSSPTPSAKLGPKALGKIWLGLVTPALSRLDFVPSPRGAARPRPKMEGGRKREILLSSRKSRRWRKRGRKKNFFGGGELRKVFSPKVYFAFFSFFGSGRGGRGQKARGRNRFQAGGVAIDRQISSREAVW